MLCLVWTEKHGSERYTRLMKQSIAYPGVTLWNAIARRHKVITNATRTNPFVWEMTKGNSTFHAILILRPYAVQAANNRSKDFVYTMKVILAVMKQLKQLQRKPRTNSEASTGFEPMTYAIPVRCSTDWAMKPRCKQLESEFDLYPLYEESEMMCIWL